MRSADRRAAPPARPRRSRAAGGGGVAHASQGMHGVWWSAAERLGVVWLVVAGSQSKPATRLTYVSLFLHALRHPLRVLV